MPSSNCNQCGLSVQEGYESVHKTYCDRWFKQAPKVDSVEHHHAVRDMWDMVTTSRGPSKHRARSTMRPAYASRKATS